MANMLILFYLFSGGKLEDNLVGIFNLFDADGNKVTKHVFDALRFRFPFIC